VTLSAALPYIAPFAALLLLLSLGSFLPLPDLVVQLLPFIVITPILWLVSRPVITLKVRYWGQTVLLGVAVFIIWVGPDILFPGYRRNWLFDNPLTVPAGAGLSAAARSSPVLLALRILRAVAIVPIAEELFWRACAMRWIVSPDFRKVPLGTYTAQSFWLVAVLFAAEHGRYWDVGLAAGMLYNWWMIRTKSLGDLILAHAITNGCLCAYVVMMGKWEYLL